MSSTLTHPPNPPSPPYTTRTILIPSTPTPSDTTGSDESPLLETPASSKTMERHRENETEGILSSIGEMAYGVEKSLRGRRASDAGVFGRRASIFDEVSPAVYIPLQGAVTTSRPDVEAAIKGIPQGWEDDMTIVIPTIPVQPRTLPLPTTTGRTNRHTGRLQSLRVLPQKGNPLAAWRARKVSTAQPNPPQGQGEDGSERDLASVPAPARARHGPFTLPPAVDPSRQSARRITEPRRFADDLYHNRSFSSSSSLAAPTVITARASHSTEEVFQTVVKADNGPPVSARSSPEQPSACTIQRHNTVYTASTTSLPASLIETPAAENPQYAPSIASQESSRSNRDRVLGLATPADTKTSQPQTKVYRQPELHEVLPFAAGRPFSAWDLGPGQTPPRVRKPSLAGVGVDRLQAEHAAVNLTRRSSLPSRRPDKQERQAARVASVRAPTRPSKELRKAAWNKPASGAFSKGKRTWLDADGQAVAPCYRLGWERPVLDLEARLHETLHELAGGKHTFASFAEDDEPATVLDIGTGTGAWPISQSLVWRSTRFVGFDAAPVQIDLEVLARAERIARSTSHSKAQGEGLWESVAKRVTWDHGDFGDVLPYDSGVFSFVHIRLLALGISEMHGTSPLEEVIRVLAPGGTLEIVEMGLVLPPSCPSATKLAFSEYLLKNVINPDPSVPIKFNIHAVEGLVLSTFAKPAYHKTWRLPSAEGACKGKGKAEDTPPAAIAEASTIWMRSVLEYSKVAMGGTTSKGPSLGLAGEDTNTKTSEPADAHFIDALRGLGNRWDFGAPCENKEKKVCREGKTAQGLDAENAALLAPKPECNEIQLWAWVGRKKG